MLALLSLVVLPVRLAAESRVTLVRPWLSARADRQPGSRRRRTRKPSSAASAIEQPTRSRGSLADYLGRNGAVAGAGRSGSGRCTVREATRTKRSQRNNDSSSKGSSVCMQGQGFAYVARRSQATGSSSFLATQSQGVAPAEYAATAAGFGISTRIRRASWKATSTSTSPR